MRIEQKPAAGLAAGFALYGAYWSRTAAKTVAFCDKIRYDVQEQRLLVFSMLYFLPPADTITKEWVH